jgi:hypothetical protein
MDEYIVKIGEKTASTGLSAEELKGRQSVRATFKLPIRVIELLNIAANQLGLKQKSLFDQLVENREILAQVAMAAGAYQPVEEQRQQKTYVVSRNSLASLNYVAEYYGLPRDFLVEISIGRLLPVISSEQKKQEKRKQVLAEMERLLGHGEALLEKSEQMLGADDHATRQLTLAVIQLKGCWDALGEQVELGKVIEGYR